MAKHDLYLRADDPNSGKDRVWFAWNFYKAAFGLWLRILDTSQLAVASDAALCGRAVQVGERRAPAKALHIKDLSIAGGEISLASGIVSNRTVFRILRYFSV